MEAYKEKLKKQRNINIVLIILAAALVAVFGVLANGRAGQTPDDYLGGFVLGGSTGLLLAVFLGMILSVVKTQRALKSEERLRALYIRETDERTQLIVQRSAVATVNASLGGLALGTAITSWFSPLVAVTLFAALAGVVFLRLGFTLYTKAKL